MNEQNKTSYPLSWPEGWPRTEKYKRQESRFLKPCVATGGRLRSMAEAVGFLQGELDRLRATKQILSTNVRTKLDGTPYSREAQPDDSGAAIYFELKGKATALACDKWIRVEDNVYAIAKHIEALRGQERWGVGSIERAFTGYQALPGIGETSGLQWWTVLGVPINATRDQAREAYALLVRKHHPDKGGDTSLFMRVQEAWEQFAKTHPADGQS